ncbi:MAG: hypothetical protein IPL55_23465 [Saprospiraceae bacterium]|jgi:hypothetical protein|nr:hypothetical protein [Saprospiraceae bacterium]
MHDIEPWWGWRDEYMSETDQNSPFYRRTYNEFNFTNKIYNYYIHPQWDFFGSETLYVKILYINYKKHYALIELIGEWNDCIGNDIMFLKRELSDELIKKGIFRFAIFCDNVLNFHGDDDSYYEEWYDDIKEENGWICLINSFDHVSEEMDKYRLYYYMLYGEIYNDINWRNQKPAYIVQSIEESINNQQKQIF